jgi:sterol desaturase/sphingolipid hydroxylase (fatty acid hydroxylase superfamily)
MFLLGFPSYAIIANNLVRHYYGYYVHADLPWTHGKLGKIFVSPAMHRWHHAACLRSASSLTDVQVSPAPRAFYLRAGCP